MGKSLIIKGADFSQNGIQFFTEATLYQGYVTTNPNNPSCGIVDLVNLTLTGNSILIKIFIPAGKSAFVSVWNDDAKVTDLNLGYIASPNDVEIKHGAKVTNIATYLHPADSSLRESDGGFLVENPTGNGLYFYMNYCYNVISGPTFPVSGKKILYWIP